MNPWPDWGLRAYELSVDIQKYSPLDSVSTTMSSSIVVSTLMIVFLWVTARLPVVQSVSDVVTTVNSQHLEHSLSSSAVSVVISLFATLSQHVHPGSNSNTNVHQSRCSRSLSPHASWTSSQDYPINSFSPLRILHSSLHKHQHWLPDMLTTLGTLLLAFILDVMISQDMSSAFSIRSSELAWKFYESTLHCIIISYLEKYQSFFTHAVSLQDAKDIRVRRGVGAVKRRSSHKYVLTSRMVRCVSSSCR